MKTLKRMTVALLALLPLATGMAVEDTDHGYTRLFVFGASLLDPGNHFADTGETAHPPFVFAGPSYGVGGHHFSNGPTWVEILAQDLGLNEWAQPAYRNPSFGNYAYGYARARDIEEDDPIFPTDPDPAEPSLGDQIADWKANGYCAFAAMDDTLFVVDTGYRDALDIVMLAPYGVDPMLIMTRWIDAIDDGIRELYACGARNFLIPNLPPLENSPIAGGPQPGGPTLTMIFNYMLMEKIMLLVTDPEKDIKIDVVNVYGIIKDFLAEPQAFGLTNVTDSCITFGVTEGAFCKNRDEYAWWDALHPTKKVHALLAAEMLEVLTASD